MGNEEWPFADKPVEFLFRKRIISLPTIIEDNFFELIKTEILTLDAICKDRITLYINSPGGIANAGLAIYDLINFVESPVATVCCGTAASAAAIILAGGEKGMRHIFPHSRVMIHSAQGQIAGSAEDIKVYQEEIDKIQEITVEIFTKHTGRTKKQILNDIKIEKWFNAQESVQYGLVDRIIASYKDLP